MPYRSPIETHRQARWRLKRYAVALGRALGVRARDLLRDAVPLASGYNGTVYGLPGGLALKLSTHDVLEAEVAALARDREPVGAPKVFAAGRLGRSAAFVLREDALPVQRAADLGLDDEVLLEALEALKGYDPERFFRSGARVLLSLWYLRSWLWGMGFDAWDWKVENLGVTRDGRVVLSDLGAALRRG